VKRISQLPVINMAVAGIDVSDTEMISDSVIRIFSGGYRQIKN